MDALIRVTSELRALDESRTQKMQERDRLIRAVRDEGATWSTIQAVTGLTSRAVAQSLRRTG